MSRLSTFALMLSSLWQVLRARLVRGPLRPTWPFAFEFAVTFMRRFSLRVFELTPPQQRLAWESLGMPSPIDRKVTRSGLTLGGVPAEELVPKKGGRERVVLYFHGGSYIYGSTKTHRELMGRIAVGAEARVIGLDYRLSPEHRFPAAAEDALGAYRALIEGGVRPEHVVLAGDSAGGALCVVTLVLARDAGLPLPAGAALLCPWVDLTATGGSLGSNEPWDWAEARMFPSWAQTYLGDAPGDDPRASPTFAELRGLPPLLVQVGGAEMLLDQVTAFADKAKAAGVEVQLRVWPDMVHNWHVFAAVHRASVEAIDELCGFLSTRTAGATLRAHEGPAP